MMITRILMVSAFLASTSAFAAATEDVQIFSLHENTANEKPFVVAIYGVKAQAIYDNTLSDVAEEETKSEDQSVDWAGWSKTKGQLECSKTYLKSSPDIFEYLCDIDLGAFGAIKANSQNSFQF